MVAMDLERRTFIGALAAALSPVSIPGVDAPTDSRFDVGQSRPDLEVVNGVFTGTLPADDVDRLVSARSSDWDGESPKPGYHTRLPVHAGADEDTENPLLTVYRSGTFLLRTQPKADPLLRVESEFSDLLQDAGFAPESVYDGMEVVSLVASGTVEIDEDVSMLDIMSGFRGRTAADGACPFTDVRYDGAPLTVVHEMGSALLFPNGTVVIQGPTDPEDSAAIKDDLDTELDAINAASGGEAARSATHD